MTDPSLSEELMKGQCGQGLKAREGIQRAVLETQQLPRISVILDIFSNCTRKPLKGCKAKSNLMIKKIPPTDFPGYPVVKTPSPQYRGPGFDPWSGNKDPACYIVLPKKRKYSSRSHGESRFRGNRVGRESS